MFFPNGSDSARGNSGTQPFGMLMSNPALSENPSTVAGNGQKLYTIQRVNGNGGNGKTDGVGGGHRHTLEDSDRVKKNSVHRYLLKKSKDEKKVVVSLHFLYTRTRQKYTSQSSGLLVDECQGFVWACILTQDPYCTCTCSTVNCHSLFSE